jgi:hypothetical protein
MKHHEKIHMDDMTSLLDVINVAKMDVINESLLNHMLLFHIGRQQTIMLYNYKLDMYYHSL